MKVRSFVEGEEVMVVHIAELELKNAVPLKEKAILQMEKLK
jgi:hypothetical protein